ncbi:MAG: putative ABC transporter permease [Bacillota bacterium]
MTEVGNQEPAFAQGISFYKLVWVFIAGSLVGTWYEEIVTLITDGVYENRSAVFVGPFNPLYGLAVVCGVLLLRNIESAPKAIVVGALFFGTFEYAANFAQEFFTGSVSWNYTDLAFDINGRTTLHYALFWGLMSYGIVFYLYPPFSQMVEAMPRKTGIVLTRILIVFLSINMLITYSALIRQGLRADGIEPFTPVGEIYDEVFTDDYIEKRFPNMEPLKDDAHE